MEKKNTLLLTVIAIATLLVAVVGATFAYFAGTTDTNANVNVNAVVANGSDSVFAATSTGDISLEVTAAMMAKEVADNSTPKVTDNANVVVKYTSSAAVTCTYDLVFTYAESSNTYTKTEGVTDKTEFILVIDKYSADVENTVEATAVTDWGTATTTTINFPSATGNIITGDEIASTVDGHNHFNRYEVTAKFYNVNYDQENLKGMTYSGTISVSTPSCSATTQG